MITPCYIATGFPVLTFLNTALRSNFPAIVPDRTQTGLGIPRAMPQALVGSGNGSYPERPTTSNFPTDTLEAASLLDFTSCEEDKNRLEVVGTGWKHLSFSNHFQPGWTTKAAPTLGSWTVGVVGRFFDTFSGHPLAQLNSSD